jgi:hypothetical protein
VTAEDVDELENCVLNNSSYYHNLNAQWFLVSLSSNALYFDSTSPVTEASLIAVLEASVRKTLFYFRSLSVLVVSDTQNQPLMTRAEASTLTDEHLLMWDALDNKAKDSGISKSDIQSIIANIFLTAHPVGSLFWTNDPTDPSVTYGGTWVRIKDKFVYAMGDNDTVNATGGAKTVTLSESNLPKHHHKVTIGTKKAKFANDATTGNVSGTGQTWTHSHGIPGAYDASGQPQCFHGSAYATVTSRTDDANLQHTHSLAGVEASVDIGSLNTDDTGSGTAFSIMPPYICKYCWERTA